MFDREIIELNRFALLRQVNLHVKCSPDEKLAFVPHLICRCRDEYQKKKKRKADSETDVSFYGGKRGLRSEN